MNASTYLAAFINIMDNLEITDLSAHNIEYDEAINAVIVLIRQQSAIGKKVIIVGNGGSASIASHAAIDFFNNGGIRALTFNDAALLTCISNDYGYPQVFARPISCFADEGDVLIAISSSGKSENILNAVKAAADLKMRVITLSGFESSNPLRRLGEYNFYVASHSYGYVEVAHQLILHTVSDIMMATGTAAK